jgi:hypothetical protein
MISCVSQLISGDILHTAKGWHWVRTGGHVRPVWGVEASNVEAPMQVLRVTSRGAHVVTQSGLECWIPYSTSPDVLAGIRVERLECH